MIEDRKIELMTILNEECAEVIQASSKVLRFNTSQNLQNLEKELGDLQCMIELVIQFGYANKKNVNQRIPEKIEKLKKFSDLFTELDTFDYTNMRQ